MDCIYLDKRGNESNTSSWVYYRVRGGGNVGDTIDICRVSFPTLSDLGDPISTPGNVGLEAAYANINKALEKQWNIDRERSILIGFR